MVSYFKNRQATKAITKRGNRGLLKVVRFIPDDKQDVEPTELVKESPKQSGKLRITATNVNVRKGPGTSFGVAMTAKQGDTFEAVNTDDWVLVAVNGAVLWVAKQYTEEVR